MAKPDTPFGHTIFCEDVRHEVNNKLTYIGVYNGTMLVDADFPITLTKLCIVANYSQRPTDEVRPLKLLVFFPTEGGEEVAVEGDIPSEGFTNATDPEIEDPIVNATINISLSPVVISAPGFIKVRAFYGDEEVRIGSLKVVRATPGSLGGAIPING